MNDLFLMSKIVVANNALQGLSPQEGPDLLEAAHERLTRLAWLLNTTCLGQPLHTRFWHLMVDSGERELRSVQLTYEKTSMVAYHAAFNQVQQVINQGVASLIPIA